MIKKKGSECSHGQMERYTKDNGNKENSMEKDRCSALRRRHGRMENGMKEEE